MRRVERRPLPLDNVDEVFIFNAVPLLPRGVHQLREGLQAGRLETVVRSPAGEEAPGPSRGYWKSAAGDVTMLTTGWAEVLKPHPLAQVFIRGHVFVTRASIASMLAEQESPARSTSAAERRAERLIADLSRTNPGAVISKAVCRQVVKAQVEGLTDRAFERAWASSAPSEWRTAGRRPKSQRQVIAAPD